MLVDLLSTSKIVDNSGQLNETWMWLDWNVCLTLNQVCADEPRLVSYVFIWYVWLSESGFLLREVGLYKNMLKILQNHVHCFISNTLVLGTSVSLECSVQV